MNCFEVKLFLYQQQVDPPVPLLLVLVAPVLWSVPALLFLSFIWDFCYSWYWALNLSIPPFFSMTFLTTHSKSSSTLEFFLAEVSKYSILYCFAFCWATSNYTFRLSSKSALFPTSTIITLVKSASFYKSLIQYSILSKESYSEMSNTSNAPSTDL